MSIDVNRVKFQSEIKCTCSERMIFDIVEDIECDWGNHTVIQCPKCEELFSVDKRCPAFKSIEELLKINPELYTKDEQLDYVSDPHPQC